MLYTMYIFDVFTTGERGKRKKRMNELLDLNLPLFLIKASRIGFV